MNRKPTILLILLALVGASATPVAGAQDANDSSSDVLNESEDPFADDEPLFNESDDPFAEYEDQAQLPNDLAGTGDGDGDSGQDGGAEAGNGSATSGDAQNGAPGLTWIATLAAASLAGLAAALARDR